MRSLVVVLFLFSFSFAIEVSLMEDTNITVDKDDIQGIRNLFVQKYNFHITDTKGAKRIVRENRLLANQFLKEGLFKKKKKEIILEIEDMLAKRYIKHLQNKTKISDKIAKSYYLDNIQKYKKLSKVTMVRYRFDNFDDAYGFYKESNTTSIDALKKKYKPNDQLTIEKEVDKLPKFIQGFVESDKESYALPPFVVSKGKIDVFYVQKYHPSDGGYIPFEEVKDRIKRELHKQTFSKERKKILEKIAQ